MSKNSFEHQIAHIAVRIGIEMPNCSGSSIGTGFLYQTPLNDGTDRTITLLISNKHVFISPDYKLTLSFNRKDDKGNPIYGDIETFEQVGFREAYYDHPDQEVDLACVNVSALSHKKVFYKHLNEVFIKDIDYDAVTQGSEVMFVGYPANRFDVVNNLPLVRKGIISSIPDVDFNGRGQVVIDAQVYQGSSGSPVFVAQGGHYTLLGVVSETMIRHSQLQTLPATIHNLGVQEILGLGIVVKQRHLKELLHHAVGEFIRRNASA